MSYFECFQPPYPPYHFSQTNYDPRNTASIQDYSVFQDFFQPPQPTIISSCCSDQATTSLHSNRYESVEMVLKKSSSVCSWHQKPQEKRNLRGRSKKLGAPDVYPLIPRQHEEMLCHKRITQGYMLTQTLYEHESLVYKSNSAKLSRLDECLGRSASLLAHAQYRHRDLAFSSYERERKKNREQCNAMITPPAPTVQHRLKERSQWFTELAQGKPLSKLARKIPHFRKKEEFFDYCVSYKIRPTRVLWLFKIHANISSNAQAKQKKAGVDSTIINAYREIFENQLSDMLKQMSTEPELARSYTYKEKWPYLMCLTKKAIEDGVIDKQEFVNNVCDPFTTFFLTRDNPAYNNPALLRMFLLMISNYMRYFTMNVIIARRCAYMLSMKLRLMKEEFDLKKIVSEEAETVDNSQTSPEAENAIKSENAEEEQSDKKPEYINSYHEMIQECKAQRSNIYLMTAFLHTLVTDAPAAMVWNKYKVTSDRQPPIISQLCGSPLDLLPCPVYDLPIPPDCNKFLAIVKARTQEIMRRSIAVEEHWFLRQKDANVFSKRIDLCLDVIGFLDSLDFKEKGVFEAAATRLFDSKTRVPHALIFKIKLMFHWAVTSEREGSHRAIVICKILKTHMNKKQKILRENDVQALIDMYFNMDSPKETSKKYDEEFGNLIALFNELIRQKIFNHDQFVKQMIAENGADVQKPLCSKFTGPVYKSSVDNGDMMFANSDVPAQPTPLIQPFPEVKDEHFNPSLWYKEKILLQVPLPQTEEYRSAANQRNMIVYGMATSRENHNSDLKKIAREICKIWQKKIYVDLLVNENKVFNPHRIAAQKIDDLLLKFRAQTYYDQVVICGWCTENYVDMIWDFINGESTILPSMEGLDLLCGMFESAQYIYGIFELCVAVLPLLPQVEKVVHHLISEIIPGSLSSQLAYVFVSYLSKHWIAYLNCGLAPTITNYLYNVVEKYLLCEEYPATCWSRVVSAFVFHSKFQLKQSGLTISKIRGKAHNFEKTFTFGSNDAAPHSQRYRYNSQFFKDVLELTRPNLFSYHEYKKRLPSFDIIDNRYSFVINSFVAAQKFGRDFDRLSHMSVLCGHLSAQVPQLADYWIAAVKVLCGQGHSSTGSFSELLHEINVKDCSNHYPLATFIMLLASKYAFNTSTLINEILGVLLNMQRYTSSNRDVNDYEPGVCLALQILACISCGTDEPYLVAKNYKGFQEKVKLIPTTADERILAMMHNCELDHITFPMLSNICILQDLLRTRVRDLDLLLEPYVENTMYRREYLPIIVKTVLAAICEQEWVTAFMDDVVKSKNMEAFNHDRLKQNCLGQQLLRMGLRRKSERNIISELTNCDSKKMLIDKLLAAMNIWNFRATLFDLKLMIKEISPDGVQKHLNQSAIAADALLGEIGKACRDLFTFAYKDGVQLSDAPDAMDKLRLPLREVTKYWLVAPLVRWCPELNNVPSSFHQSTSVCGKVLKEAGSMLDATMSNGEFSVERHAQGSWLLTQQSFINLILSCTKVEQKNNGASKEMLIVSLHKQIQDYVNKTKEDPTRLYLDKYLPEREGVLLRLSLVGGIFPLICCPGQSENWALLLFQLMLHGIVSHDQERVMYDTIYDMLSTLMLWTLIDEKNQTTTQAEAGEIRHRWPTYVAIIKKLKKELPESRITGSIRHLHQFFSISKRSKPIICCEPYGTLPAPASILPARPQRPTINTSVGLRHGRLALQATEKIRLYTFDMVPAYYPDPQKAGAWRWSMYQPLRSHWFPSLPHRLIEKYIQHKHITEFTRPPAYIHSENMPTDPFLTAPAIEITGEPVSTTTATTSSTTTSVTNSVAGSPNKDDATKDKSEDTGPTTASPKLRTPKKEEPMEIGPGEQGPEIIPVSTTPDIKPAPILQKTPPNTVSPKAGRGGGTRKRNSGSTGAARQPQPKKQRSNSRTDQNATPTSFANWPAHPQPPHMNTAPGIGGFMGQSGHQMLPGSGMPPPQNPAANMHPGQIPVTAGTGMMGQPPPQAQSDSCREQLHSLIQKRIQEREQAGQTTQPNMQSHAQQSMPQDSMAQSQGGGFNGGGQHMNRQKAPDNTLPGQMASQQYQQQTQQQLHNPMQHNSKQIAAQQLQQPAVSAQGNQQQSQAMQKVPQGSLQGMATSSIPSNMIDTNTSSAGQSNFQTSSLGYGNQNQHPGLQAPMKPGQPAATTTSQARQLAPPPVGTASSRPQPPPIPQQLSQNSNPQIGGMVNQMRPGQTQGAGIGMNSGGAQIPSSQHVYGNSGSQPSQPPPAYNHPSHAASANPVQTGASMNQGNAAFSSIQQQQQSSSFGHNFSQNNHSSSNTSGPLGNAPKQNPSQQITTASQQPAANSGMATVKTEPSIGQQNQNPQPHGYPGGQHTYQQQGQTSSQQQQQMQNVMGSQPRNTMGQFASKDESRMNPMQPQQRPQQMSGHGMPGAGVGLGPNPIASGASGVQGMAAHGMGPMGSTSTSAGLGIGSQITTHSLGSGGQLIPQQGANYMQETKPMPIMGQPGMAVGPSGQPKPMTAQSGPQGYNPGYQHPQMAGPNYAGMGQHVGYSQGGHMPNMGMPHGMNTYQQQYMMNDNRMMGGHNQYPPYNQGPPYNNQQ